eukprot:2397244-Rhodomonas_salina.4
MLRSCTGTPENWDWEDIITSDDLLLSTPHTPKLGFGVTFHSEQPQQIWIWRLRQETLQVPPTVLGHSARTSPCTSH